MGETQLRAGAYSAVHQCYLLRSGCECFVTSFRSKLKRPPQFCSFMAVSYVPAYLEDFLVFRKDRANGFYGPTLFHMTNFLIGIPYLCS